MKESAVSRRRAILLPLRLPILVVLATVLMGFSTGQPATNGMHDKNLGAEIKPDGGMYAEYDARQVVTSGRRKVHGDFTQLRRLPARERAAAYLQLTEQHRLNALQVAQMVRGRALPPKDGRRIRAALSADLSAWRETFDVPRRNWQAMRDQWLVRSDSLTTEQWALQRANWFAARDAWIAQQLQLTQVRAK